MDRSYHFFLLFNEIINKLKGIERTGWKLSNIRDAETVADHTFHVAGLTLLLANLSSEKLDYHKLFVLAILHDISEAVYGDIPAPEKTEEDRYKEVEWIKGILEKLDYPIDWADDLHNISSRESIIIKMADYMATIVQGLSYLENYKRCHEHLLEILTCSSQKLLELSDSLKEENISSLVKRIVNNMNETIDKICK